MYKNLGRKQHFRASLGPSHLTVLREHPAQAPWFSCLLPRINHIHQGFSALSLTIRLTISHKSVELEEFARMACTGFSFAFFFFSPANPWYLALSFDGARGFSQCFPHCTPQPPPHFSIPFFFLPWKCLPFPIQTSPPLWGFTYLIPTDS